METPYSTESSTNKSNRRIQCQEVSFFNKITSFWWKSIDLLNCNQFDASDLRSDFYERGTHYYVLFRRKCWISKLLYATLACKFTNVRSIHPIYLWKFQIFLRLRDASKTRKSRICDFQRYHRIFFERGSKEIRSTERPQAALKIKHKNVQFLTRACGAPQVPRLFM